MYVRVLTLYCGCYDPVLSCFFFAFFWCVRIRPVDSPYALEKKKEAGRKGPAGQKGAHLSELDLLVGDVLYFNHRVS